MKVLTREELAELKGGMDRNYLSKKNAHASVGSHDSGNSSSNESGIDWLHEVSIGLYSAIVGPVISGVIYAATSN